MDEKFIDYKQNPELLKGRFENGFPLLYPMDTIEISSRWAGNGKNSLEGKRGYVHNVRHGIQSIFNRDYLIVGAIGGEELGNIGDFESWLYTLDLVERDETTGIAQSVIKQFGCLPYVDDRVRIIKHPNFQGKIGRITSLEGTGSQGGWLGLNITDEVVSNEIKQYYTRLNKRIAQEFQKRNVAQGFDNFVIRIKGENLEIYLALEQEGRTRQTYERLLKDEVYKELAIIPELQDELRTLQEKSQFFVSSKDVELIERFPPNDLFKTN